MKKADIIEILKSKCISADQWGYPCIADDEIEGIADEILLLESGSEDKK